MCTCSQPLDYDYHPRSSTRPLPPLSTYDRHHSPPRSKRYRPDAAATSTTYLRSPSAYAYAAAAATTRVPLSSRRRRPATPPPVLIQSTPMGRAEASPRLSPGGRFSRSSGLDSPTSSGRSSSGEMGFNQPMVLQDGFGPVIHQQVGGGGGHGFQAAHNTGYAPHAHRAAGGGGGQRRYSVNVGGDRVRSSYIGYRSDQGSVGSDDSYGSGERRVYTNEVRRGFGGRNSGEGLYSSMPVRRYS